jgi:hypothetical protein
MFINSKLLVAIRGFAALVIMGLFVLFLISAKTKKVTDDIWNQLGLTLPEAQRDINNSFIYGHFDYSGAKYAKNIAAGDRTAVVNQLVAYTKKYWTSKEFTTAYNNYRMQKKPAEPTKLPVTAESIKAQEKDRLEKNLKTAEEGLNSTNPKIKNGAPTRIDNIKKELAALDDPNNATIKRRLDDARRSDDYALKLYEQALQKFEMEYPADPTILLKKRLQEILDITENIDYAAELQDRGRFKVFANPDYEKKPKEWKLAYRAGKQTTDAVRAAARQWLKELK